MIMTSRSNHKNWCQDSWGPDIIPYLRPQGGGGGGGGSEVNFEILRYVVELDLNFQMLLSLLKTNFPI